MNPRILTLIFVAACLASLAGVALQRSTISALRAERQKLIDGIKAAEERQSPAGDPVSLAPRTDLAQAPYLELLQLRGQVARLTDQRRELAAVRSENERLRVQATRRTNATSTNVLPPGYIRKSDARFAGYNTPADTLQSLLWAVQNRDFTNMMAAFTPEMARQLQEQFDRGGADEFFKDASALPGMHIVNQKQTPEGEWELTVEMIPGQPPSERMRFRQINGEWKLATD